MSIENRVARLRQEGENASSPHSYIIAALNSDAQHIWSFYTQSRYQQIGGATPNPIDQDIIDTYELQPADIPTLALPRDFSFTDGFSYIRNWLPYIRAVGEGMVAPEDEHIMDSQLARMFPDRFVTTQNLRGSLALDPSGATFLNKMADAELTEGTLSLIGARKAITGIKNMYEALAAANS